MSQEKVDQYKKNKANRQKIMRREKILRRLEITVARWCWWGWSAGSAWLCIRIPRPRPRRMLRR